MNINEKSIPPDFKGLGFSKIGHFKEVRSKIKELEKLNIQLAKRHNRLEAIFNSMSDRLTILDRNLTIVFANRVQKKMFPESGGIGVKCHQLLQQKSSPCHNCPALITKKQQKTLRGEILIKKGMQAGRYYEWVTSPITNLAGKVEEIILILRDITERKEFEFKLMQTDRLAAIGFLAAGVAHEINNPLTSIAGFSEGLLKRTKQLRLKDAQHHEMFASFQDYLQIINDEAYRCKDIIQNLQTFSRNSKDDFEKISISRVINDTAALMRQHAKDNHISIVIQNHLATGFDSLRGKESQLKHLFLNLFNNAFKAMPNGGELLLKAYNNGNTMEITILDTGVVSLRKRTNNIFNPASATNPSSDDAALDLAICYNIVKHHQGDIEFKSIHENGNQFTLRFPTDVT